MRWGAAAAAVLLVVGASASSSGAPAGQPSHPRDLALDRDERDQGSTANAPTRTRRIPLGPTDDQRESTWPQLDFAFGSRADEELVGARVHVELARAGAEPAAAQPIEVLVNDQRVALLAGDALAPGRRHDIPVGPALLAPRSQLSVRLAGVGGGRCSVARGAWRSLAAVEVDLEAAPSPLPDDLALLPVPFFDRDVDTSATVPVVLAAATRDRVRLAALAASWLALEAPIPVRFVAHVGSLPDASALVLLAGPADAQALGLQPPQGAGVRMIDHPRHPGSNRKLVVVAGGDAAELRGAVETLAQRRPRLAGDAVALPRTPPDPPSPPYSAPRWLPSGRAVRLSEEPVTGVLAHDGATSATLLARFRIAPDLFFWPSELVLLDLAWSERLPPGVAPPRLDAEMNGFFLTTLPAPAGPGEHRGTVRLRVPRQHLRGFNELRVHVHYPPADPCAPARSGGARDPPRVAIDTASTLHLEGFRHFATLPDVALFAYDGFPFTRVPDLGETAVVLPERPAEAEISLVLSLFGRFAQETGRAGVRAAFLGENAADGELTGRDLLVVGGPEHALVRRWEARLPVTSGLVPRRQPGASPALDLLGGLGPIREPRRARAIVAQARGAAAVVGIESPAAPGRSAVFVTAASRADLPPLDRFLGYAESSDGPADLLVAAGDRRWMFRIGPSFTQGRLDAFARVRWFLARHWLVLLPVVGVGVVVLAAPLRGALDDRMRERLSGGGERR